MVIAVDCNCTHNQIQHIATVKSTNLTVHDTTVSRADGLAKMSERTGSGNQWSPGGGDVAEKTFSGDSDSISNSLDC